MDFHSGWVCWMPCTQSSDCFVVRCQSERCASGRGTGEWDSEERRSKAAWQHCLYNNWNRKERKAPKQDCMNESYSLMQGMISSVRTASTMEETEESSLINLMRPFLCCHQPECSISVKYQMTWFPKVHLFGLKYHTLMCIHGWSEQRSTRWAEILHWERVLGALGWMDDDLWNKNLISIATDEAATPTGTRAWT